MADVRKDNNLGAVMTVDFIAAYDTTGALSLVRLALFEQGWGMVEDSSCLLVDCQATASARERAMAWSVCVDGDTAFVVPLLHNCWKLVFTFFIQMLLIVIVYQLRKKIDAYDKIVHQIFIQLITCNSAISSKATKMHGVWFRFINLQWLQTSFCHGFYFC